MIYERINWLNSGEVGAKPINKTTLNIMDEAIAYLFEHSGGGGGDNTPIGTIFAYGGETIPEGYLLANGQAVSRTEYVDLFNVYGTTYGEGDGSTTFNVPDYRDKIPVGLNVNTEYFNALGKTGGEITHTLTVDEMPSHNHKLFWGTTEGGTGNSIKMGIDYAGLASEQMISTGENQPHNNLQPYIVTNYIIKAIKVTPTQAEVEDSLESNSTTNAPSIHAVNEALKGLNRVCVFNGSGVSGSPITINKTWGELGQFKNLIVEINYETNNSFTTIIFPYENLTEGNSLDVSPRVCNSYQLFFNMVTNEYDRVHLIPSQHITSNTITFNFNNTSQTITKIWIDY